MNFKHVIFLLCMVFFLPFSHSQRAPGDVGVGVQFGSPSGLSLQFYKATGPSLDLIAAWNLDDFFYLNGHGLYQKHIGNSGNFHFIYGPGAFVGFIDRGDKIHVDAGISGTVGLSLLIDKFEIYGRVTPRLALVDSTDADIGGGLGLRFYF